MYVEAPGTRLAMCMLLWQIHKTGGRPGSSRYPFLDVPSMQDTHEPLPLMFNDVAERLLNSLTLNKASIDRLSTEQGIVSPSKLKGIYAHLAEHPGLLQRRLYIGSKKPEINVSKRSKRTFDLDFAQPVCPSRTEWSLLHDAKDINDTNVQVFQPENGQSRSQQWFYTVTCNNRAFSGRRDCPGCCIGINHESYQSSCEQKKTYVMALVRRPYQDLPDWDWIQVNSGCECAITPQFDLLFPL